MVIRVKKAYMRMIIVNILVRKFCTIRLGNRSLKTLFWVIIVAYLLMGKLQVENLFL